MDDPNTVRTIEWYQRFADFETVGQSPLFQAWAFGVADDPAVLDLLYQLPLPKRQPNLFFACARWVGVPLGSYDEFRAFAIENWAALAAEMMVRATQTNEPGRCSLLLPALGMIDGPLAILEVGASAGLCLYPDRYSYSYDGRRFDPETGPSTVLLECATTGNPPIPERMPRIAWRAGLDLNPLDVSNADDVRWLETLIWPEQTERLARIRAAIDIVAADPPRIVQGDAVEGLSALVAEAPADLTLVIIDSVSIVYLMPEPRAKYIEYVTGSGARGISNEGRGIVPSAAEGLPDTGARERSEMVLALDGKALVFTGGHGQRLGWLND